MSQDKTAHRQNVIGQNATQTKCHMDKILERKTPHGQNVTGCANKMNRPRTKRHTDKMPYGQDHMPYGQDHTTYHGQNV